MSVDVTSLAQSVWQSLITSRVWDVTTMVLVCAAQPNTIASPAGENGTATAVRQLNLCAAVSGEVELQKLHHRKREVM